MLNDLTYFDNSIVGRYRTVERNIKSKSNSFFDSYLDLLENTIKRKVGLKSIHLKGKLALTGQPQYPPPKKTHLKY